MAMLYKSDFTTTELSILNLLRDGKSRRDISEILPYCERTIYDKAQHIRLKLNAKTPEQMMCLAIKYRLISNNDIIE